MKRKRELKILKKNSFLLSFLMIFIIGASLVDAALVVTPSNINLTKTAGTSANFNFQISNPDTFTYYNVTFSDGVYATMPLIPTLSSGQMANVTGVAISNSTGVYALKIKGLYYTNIGTSNKTYNINLTSGYGAPNPCSFTAIQGDTLLWNNKAANSITIKNMDTGQDIATLAPSISYQIITSAPMTLNYGLYVSGFNYASCSIAVISGSGYVNNPEYNGVLNLNLTNIYAPTALNSSSSASSYTINFSEVKEGVLTLINVGDKPAYNVNLQGEWFTFSANNFNLAVGESKPIIYTLIPIILTTADTNKNYTKAISITGNFPTITHNFNIFVPFENINMDNATSDFWTQRANFCKSYPSSVYCITDPLVVYKYVSNASDNEFNVTMSQQQVRDLWLYNIGLNDKVETGVNYVKETAGNTDERINATDAKVDQLLAISEQNKKDTENMVTNLLVWGSIVFIVTACIVVAALIYMAKKKEKLRKINDWSME